MQKSELISTIESTLTHISMAQRFFEVAKDKIGAVTAAIAAASDLEHEVVQCVRLVRARLLERLGPDVSVAKVESALAARLREAFAHPEQLASLLESIEHALHGIDLALEAPAPEAALEPSSEAAEVEATPTPAPAPESLPHPIQRDTFPTLEEYVAEGFYADSYPGAKALWEARKNPPADPVAPSEPAGVSAPVG